MKGVYLIHFDRPFGHARHYTGYADDLAKRLEAHRRGSGARLIQVVNDAGIGWRLARVWLDADRDFERKLKHRHGASRYCPLCGERKLRGVDLLPSELAAL